MDRFQSSPVVSSWRFSVDIVSDRIFLLNFCELRNGSTSKRSLLELPGSARTVLKAGGSLPALTSSATSPATSPVTWPQSSVVELQRHLIAVRISQSPPILMRFRSCFSAPKTQAAKTKFRRIRFDCCPLKKRPHSPIYAAWPFRRSMCVNQHVDQF